MNESATVCRKPSLVVQYKEADRTCVGFTATKRLGNAVTRNRAKRRLRCIARAVLPNARVGWYVFIAKPTTLTMPYTKLLQDARVCASTIG
jgi:ribonuclease P protein component